MKRHYLSLLGSMSIIAFAAANEGGGGSVSGLSVTEALDKLGVDNADDWTEAGLPSMARMKELTGNADLTRADVGEAKPGFNRSTLSDKAPELTGAAAEKQRQADERLAETHEQEKAALAASQAGDQSNEKADADAAAADAARQKRHDDAQAALEHEQNRPQEAGNVDHSSSTQHDAIQQDRLGDDFGLDPKDDQGANVPVDSRGIPATDIDVQAVGLQEKLTDEEAQAQSAAALAGDTDEQSDYDAGFIRGYELGKSEGAKGIAEQAKPEELPEATREQRNAEVATATAAPADVDISAIVEAAGGDAIALCEALVQAAAGDDYKRNSALTSFVRGYMVSQAEIKEVQRRLDVRNEQRASESARQRDGLSTLKA